MKDLKKGDIVNVRIESNGHYKEIKNGVVESVRNFNTFSDVHVVEGDYTSVTGNMGFMGVSGWYNLDYIEPVYIVC